MTGADSLAAVDGESLWSVTRGQGPELVLLHGWGLHSDVWAPLQERLEAAFRVTHIDLPGHGHSKDSQVPADLAGWSRAVRAVAPQRAVWLGWSLGGQVALRTALDAPERVAGLIAVASTPRFLSASDWPHGMAPETLEAFAGELAGDFRGTVEQFLSLQVQGAPDARAQLRELRAQVFRHGEPSHQALERGLAILRRTDLRAELRELRMPVLVLSGRLDRLTPPEAGRAMAEGAAAGAYHCFPRAAHAPFLSDPEPFVELIDEFIQAG